VYSSPCELATPGLFSRLRDGGWETRGLAEKGTSDLRTARRAVPRSHSNDHTRGPAAAGAAPAGAAPAWCIRASERNGWSHLREPLGLRRWPYGTWSRFAAKKTRRWAATRGEESILELIAHDLFLWLLFVREQPARCPMALLDGAVDCRLRLCAERLKVASAFGRWILHSLRCLLAWRRISGRVKRRT